MRKPLSLLALLLLGLSTFAVVFMPAPPLQPASSSATGPPFSVDYSSEAKNQCTSATSCSITGFTTSYAGMIWVWIQNYEQTPTVTATGLKFTLYAHEQNGPSGFELWGYYAFATAALSSVTLSMTETGSANTISMLAYGVSGVDTLFPFDYHPSGGCTGSSSGCSNSALAQGQFAATSSPTVTINTLNSHDIIIGVEVSGGAGSDNGASATAGFQMMAPAITGNPNLQAENGTFTSTQSALSAGFTDSSVNWAMIFVALMPSGAELSSSTDFVSLADGVGAGFTGSYPDTVLQVYPDSWAYSSTACSQGDGLPMQVYFANSTTLWGTGNLTSEVITNHLDKYSVQGTVAGIANKWTVNYTLWTHDAHSSSISVTVTHDSGTSWLSVGYEVQGGKCSSSSGDTFGNATTTSLFLVDGASSSSPHDATGNKSAQLKVTSSIAASTYSASTSSTFSMFYASHKYDDSSSGTIQTSAYYGGLGFNTTSTETIQLGIAATEGWETATNVNTEASAASTASVGELKTNMNKIFANLPLAPPLAASGNEYADYWAMLVRQVPTAASTYKFRIALTSSTSSVITATNDANFAFYTHDSSQVPGIIAVMNSTYLSSGVQGNGGDTAWDAQSLGMALKYSYGSLATGEATYLGNLVNMTLPGGSSSADYNAAHGIWQYSISGDRDSYFWNVNAGTWPWVSGGCNSSCFTIDKNYYNLEAIAVLIQLYTYAGNTAKAAQWQSEYNGLWGNMSSFLWDSSLGIYVDRYTNGTAFHNAAYTNGIKALDNGMMLTFETNATRAADIQKWLLTYYPSSELPTCPTGCAIDSGYITSAFSIMGMYSASVRFTLPDLAGLAQGYYDRNYYISQWANDWMGTVESSGWYPLLTAQTYQPFSPALQTFNFDTFNLNLWLPQTPNPSTTYQMGGKSVSFYEKGSGTYVQQVYVNGAPMSTIRPLNVSFSSDLLSIPLGDVLQSPENITVTLGATPLNDRPTIYHVASLTSDTKVTTSSYSRGNFTFYLSGSTSSPWVLVNTTGITGTLSVKEDHSSKTYTSLSGGVINFTVTLGSTHQIQITNASAVDFSITGTMQSSAPSATFTLSGGSITPTSVLFDGTAKHGFTGSGTITITSPSCGSGCLVVFNDTYTVTSLTFTAANKTFTFKAWKIYALNVTGGNSITYSVASEAGGGYWNYGDSVAVTSNGVWSRSAGAGTRATQYAIDGGAPVTEATTSTFTTTSVTMTASHAVVISSTAQYELTTNSAGASALVSCTSPSISGDDYWYDTGTSASCTFNGVYGRSSGSGTRVSSYDWDGGSATAESTTGTFTTTAQTMSATHQADLNTVTQYQFTISHTGSGSTTVSTSPTISGDTGWYDAATSVSFSATASGSTFNGWTCTGSGCYSGSANPASVTMNAAISETAGFGAGPLVYGLTVSYSVTGGGSPTAPTLNYVNSTGSAKTATVTSTPTFYASELGSSWSVTPNPLTGTNSTDRWYSDATLSGTIPDNVTVAPAYYHQYNISMEYVLSDAAATNKPTFTLVSFGETGTHMNSKTAAFYWADSGSKWGAESPFTTSGDFVTYYANATSGTVTRSDAVVIGYSAQDTCASNNPATLMEQGCVVRGILLAWAFPLGSTGLGIGVIVSFTLLAINVAVYNKSQNIAMALVVLMAGGAVFSLFFPPVIGTVAQIFLVLGVSGIALRGILLIR